MKVFLIFLVLFPTYIFCQDPKVTLKKDDWAGGVCCSSGTRYHLSITIDPRNENCFERVLLRVDNIYLELDETKFNIHQWNDSMKVFTYDFGISSHERYGQLENITISYFGMTESDFYESENPVNDITFHYSAKRTKITSYEFIETFTAYP